MPGAHDISVTDELLCRAFDAGSQMGCVGNSLSHLLLSLADGLKLLDSSLQAYSLMSRE